MAGQDKVNILLVDDQPGKLLTYEAILGGLGENLLKASSGREALEHLLRSEIAVILVDVCMPDLDGFQLAAMIREHPRYQKIAMIFISAIHLSELDRLRGYEMGAVDYVPVPVVPEVLRAKVRVFSDLYRKSRDLETLNAQLEARVTERTAQLEASTAQLVESERRRTLALAAGQMGGWDFDRAKNHYFWDIGQRRIFGVGEEFRVTAESIRALIYPEDLGILDHAWDNLLKGEAPFQMEYRVRRPNGEIRWCLSSAAATRGSNDVLRVSGVTIDITERKAAEERQLLLSREVDHRAKNALALVQSIVRLTRHTDPAEYARAVEGRISALSRVHTVLSQSRWQGADLEGLLREELEPFMSGGEQRISVKGPTLSLEPACAQTLALALHELTTNAAKYGALSHTAGALAVDWGISDDDTLNINWCEQNEMEVSKPERHGFGTKIVISSIQNQLGGRVHHDWQPRGMRCILDIPLITQLGRTQPSDVGFRRNVRKTSLTKITSADNIMIVEDESLLGLSLQQVLSDLGYSVVGPYGCVAEALRGLDSQPIDAAILDVNLAGEFVYPLADLLRTRNIPFVFATGYSLESIDPRFDEISILQKPIDRQALETIFSRKNPSPSAAAGLEALGNT